MVFVKKNERWRRTEELVRDGYLFQDKSARIDLG